MDSVPSISTTATASRNKYLLNAADRDYLRQERKLEFDWLYANCGSADIPKASLLLGYEAKSPCIVFYGDKLEQLQLRPHLPWASKKGELPKYRTPIGEYNAFLAKHPEIEGYWRDLDALKARCFTINGKPYLLITEGCIKSITGCMHGIPTVGLMGVDMGLTPKSKGKPDLVPVLKRLAEAGFGFIIAFDSDIEPKTVAGVAGSEARLTKVLKTYGCDVLSVTGTWNHEDGKGMDDYINKKRIEAFRAILMQAGNAPESPVPGDITTRKPPTPQAVTARLAEEFGHQLKYDEEQQTWRKWSGKYWEKMGLGAFKSWLKNTLDGKGAKYGGSAYLDDVRKLLECDLRQLKWQFWDKSRYINFNNCVFDGAKAKSEPHCPGMGFTSHLPYDYKPLEGDLGDSLEALRLNCPKLHKFLRTAMQDDERKMFKLLAIINALLKYRFFDLQMFVHLVGAPGSGKGKFMRFCQKLVGKGNTIACQLDKLGDGSTKASLMDKQLVVFPDERKPVGIDSILSLTGGDEISYRELYQPAASAHFYGSIMIASNKPIFIGDTTGLERRLCLVNFDNPIAVEERKHSLEAELDSEIPACIAIALSLSDDAVTQAIQGIGASRIAEYKAKEWEMKVEVNSVAAFFDAELVLDPLATTRVGKIYDAYKYFCEEGGLSKFSIVKFPRLLADIFTDENLPVTRHQGAVAYFEGVRIRENSDTHLTHSQVLEGVSEGVTGSLQGVDEGVALPQDKGLRELREFDSKSFTGSTNDDNFLPDEEESDREINLEGNLPPSTPSTPSNPVPVTTQTPSPTPSQVPSTTPSTPSNVATAQNKFLGEKLADRMREAIAKGSREDAKEVMERVASSAPQIRGFFNKSFSKEETLNIRLLKYCGLTKGTSVKYVGEKFADLLADEILTVDDLNAQNEIACLRPDGKGFTTWLNSEDLHKL